MMAGKEFNMDKFIMKLCILSLVMSAGCVATVEDTESEVEEVPNGYDLKSPSMAPIGPKPAPLGDDRVSTIQKSIVRGSGKFSNRNYPR